MKRLIISIGLLLVTALTYGQYVQWTLRPGPVANQVDVYLRPNFNFNPTNAAGVYFSQIQFAIAWQSNCPTIGQPTVSFTIDPTLNTYGGGSYNTSVFARSSSVSPAGESYCAIFLERVGSGAQMFSSGVEVKVGTVTMGASAPACAIKIADYSDMGLDTQGNCFAVQSNTATYLRSPISSNNFYAIQGISGIGGDATFGYAQLTSNISLPVKLKSFSGTQNNCMGTLNWQTAEEVNFSHFEVEQSLDGAAYTKAGTVAAAGGTAAHAYKFSTGTLDGRKYYRLKLVDNDGKFTYSNVVLLTANCGGSGYGAMVYPNPAGKGTDVNVNLHGFTGSISGKLFDVQGRLVNTQTLKNGTNVLSTARLSAGMYQLTLQDTAGNIENKKIIIAE